MSYKSIYIFLLQTFSSSINIKNTINYMPTFNKWKYNYNIKKKLNIIK